MTSPADDSVTRIDPVAGQPVQTISVGADPDAIAYGFGSVWVANGLDSTVTRINPSTGTVTQTIPVGNGPSALAVGTTGVWVANAAAGTVVRIDPATGRVASSLRVGDPALAVAMVGGAPWVATGVGYASRHRGGTLRLLSSAWFGTIDPALSYPAAPALFTEATYDTLVTFQRTGGSGGLQLVPDLALALPTPQAGGTQYTFVLRPGLRYSNGTPVRPQDFRYALERVFVLNPRRARSSPGFSARMRAAAAHPVTCPARITVDDHARTVTFHLTAPDGDFLYKLAFPFTAPVPASVPAHDVGTSPVPATGPYMITRDIPGREVDLARNPEFRQWSAAAQPDGFPDRIVWKFGLTPAQEVAAIEAGRADWMADPPPDVASLVARYDSQVHINPLPGIAYVAFNVTVPPFNDTKVRQAVSLAADRNQAVSGPGRSQAPRSPPARSSPPACPGTGRTARSPSIPVLAGRGSAPTSPGPGAWWPPRTPKGCAWSCGRTSSMARSGPTSSGCSASWDTARRCGLPRWPHSRRNVNDSRRRVQASVGSWIVDYPSASDFFNLFFRCSAFRSADPADTRSGDFFCDPASTARWTGPTSSR